MKKYVKNAILRIPFFTDVFCDRSCLQKLVCCKFSKKKAFVTNFWLKEDFDIFFKYLDTSRHTYPPKLHHMFSIKQILRSTTFGYRAQGSCLHTPRLFENFLKQSVDQFGH